MRTRVAPPTPKRQSESLTVRRAKKSWTTTEGPKAVKQIQTEPMPIIPELVRKGDGIVWPKTPLVQPVPQELPKQTTLDGVQFYLFPAGVALEGVTPLSLKDGRGIYAVTESQQRIFLMRNSGVKTGIKEITRKEFERLRAEANIPVPVRHEIRTPAPMASPVGLSDCLHFFWSNNATRTPIKFTVKENLGGVLTGYLSTRNFDEISKLRRFCEANSTCREVAWSEFERLSGVKLTEADRTECDEAAKKREKNRNANATVIVQLGRAGDIINILPLAKALSEIEGSNPAVLCAKQYVGLLEGVSYVEPIAWDGAWDDPVAAGNWARDHFGKVLEAQCYGKGLRYEVKSASFCKESWRRAGHENLWGRELLRFDRRNREREANLASRLSVPATKPVLLVNMQGNSSPYAGSQELWAELERRWEDKCDLIDLGCVQAEELQDLLGLYDQAAGLITIDTATLHLAAATLVPTCALITDQPTMWHGATAHRKFDLELRYSESRKPSGRQRIHNWIEGLLKPRPMFFHLCSAYPGKGEDRRRNELAALTWKTVHNDNWKLIKVQDEELPRLFQDTNKDGGPGRKLPFINDIIDIGFLRGAPWVVLTNTDTCFSPMLERKLRWLIDKGTQAIWAHRRDFARLDKPLTDREIIQGKWYCGTDLFAMSREWWLEYRTEMPDMILGAEAWDCLLRELMKLRGGGEIHGAIYHERHDSTWEKAENRYTLPSQEWCLTRARRWLKDHGLPFQQFGIK